MLLAAAFVMAIGPRSAEAQKALVFCPTDIDATGCSAVATALTAGKAFPGGVDKGYTGTQGTVDLRSTDLSAYRVFVVPSLAEGAGTRPYALLRDSAVAARLRSRLVGRRAIYAGTPDQGTLAATRPAKDALIRSLARWAAAPSATAHGPGLVVLQDQSADAVARYDWLRPILGVTLTADPTPRTHARLRPVTAAGREILTDGGAPLAYGNMASFGFAVPDPGSGLTVSAVGTAGAGGAVAQDTTGASGPVVLLTQEAGALGVSGTTVASTSVVRFPPMLTWLAPLGTGTPDPATFDAAAAPVVEVCVWADSACAAPPVVRFTTAPGARGASTLPLTVNATVGQYEASWSLANVTKRERYRIRVLQGATELGAVSVDVIRNQWGLTPAAGLPAAPLIAATALPIRFALAPPPTLTVLRDPGVRGTPAAGVTPYYALGTRVSYAFEAMAGYEHLRVQVDGVDAPAVGTITMGASHQILAFASRIPVVSAAAQPVVPLARALLTATDAAAAQRASLAYTAAARTLYQTLGPVEAQRQLAEVAALTFDPVRDSAALRQTTHWLAQARPVFTQVTAAPVTTSPATTSPAGPRASRASRAASTGTTTDAVAGTRPTTVIYVNGVLSTLQTAQDGLVGVQWLAMEAGLARGDPDLRITNVHNDTWLAAPVSGPLSCIMGASTNPLTNLLGKVAGVMGCVGRLLGPVEVVAQWAAGILGTTPLTTPISSEVGQVVRGELDAGRKVLLFGHSQGNMIIQQALRGLEQTLPAAAMQCVAVTSAAPPVTVNWPTVLWGGFYAKGSHTRDVLLSLIVPTPGGTMVRTDVTDAADARIEAALARADESGGGGVQTLTENAKLHAFVDSYLYGDNLRIALRENLAAHAQALETQCRDAVVVTSPPATVAVGATATLSAEVRSATGVTLAGRSVAWASIDPAVARVDAAGVVTGVSAGTATIRATSGSVHADVTLTISGSPPPPDSVRVPPPDSGRVPPPDSGRVPPPDSGRVPPPDDESTPAPPGPPPAGGGSGYSSGDPHLMTVDGRAYDFQAVGDFVLSKATGADADLEVQVRYTPWNASPSISITEAVALRVGADVVNVFPLTRGGFDLVINDEPIAGVTALSRALPGGGSVLVGNDEATVSWPDGSVAKVRLYAAVMVLKPSRSGKVEGLLGDYDGDRTNDLRVRNGRVLSGTLDGLYQDFRLSWRVPSGESLFRRGSDPWNPAFPAGSLSLGSFDPTAVERARDVCRAAGVVTAAVLDQCALDILVTGDNSWAARARASDLGVLRVTVTPALSYLAVGQSREFAAVVTGATNPGVTWRSSGGSITATGQNTVTYTAPSTLGEYTLTAVSAQDGRVSSQVRVIVGLAGLSPSADTYISEVSSLGGADKNHGGDNRLLAITLGGYQTYPLIRFDLTGYAGRTISGDGVLYLNLQGVGVDPVYAPLPRSISAYQVLVNWDPATVTFNSFGTSPGLQIGADVAPSPFTVVDGITWANAGEYVKFTVPRALLQAWIDRPESNAGILLRNEAAGLELATTFGSSRWRHPPVLALPGMTVTAVPR
jgi:hypothetical protein